MSMIGLVFHDAPLSVLNAVIVECAKPRDHIIVNLARGPKFAPQVNCSGSQDGVMVYHIETPSMESAGAPAVMAAADAALTVTTGIKCGDCGQTERGELGGLCPSGQCAGRMVDAG